MRSALLMVTCLIAGSASAQTFMATPAVSGAWYDPARVGQGLLFEVVQNGTQKELLTYWYTFTPDGQPLWLYGQATLGATGANMPMSVVSGPRFAQPGGLQQLTLTPWGTLNVSFRDCNAARADYNGSFGTGGFDLIRLTRIAGQLCTGTIADNSSGGAGGNAFTRFLSATSAAPAASGKVQYSAEPGRVEFSVEAEDVPVGAYDVVVAGVTRASVTVSARTGGGTQGEVEFRAPVEPGKLPLDFDPLGKSVTVQRNGQVFLTGVVIDDSNGSTPIVTGAPPFGNSTREYTMNATGGGRCKAELEQRSDRVKFEVEIEQTITGAYTLVIGGIQRATINVSAVTGGNYGQVEFENPKDGAKPLLDFDPRGQSIVLTRAGTAVCSGTFPSG